MAKRYDLGSVIGRIVMDYDGKGTRAAERDVNKFKKSLDDTDKKIGTFKKKFEDTDNAANKLAKTFVLTAGALGSLSSGVNIVVALGGAVAAASGVVGLLPGAFAAAGAAAITLKLGADGIKKSFDGLTPTLDNMKKSTSAVFEKSLQPAIDNLKKGLPQLQGGINGVAASLSGVVVNASRFFLESSNISRVNTIFGATRTIIDNVAAAVSPLISAFVRIAAVAAPMIAQLTSGFGDLATQFNIFVAQAAGDGRLEAWIQTGINAFKELWAIIVQVGGIIQAIFHAMGEAGAGFSGTLSQVLLTVNKFLSSFQGQEALKSFFTTLNQVGKVVSEVLLVALQQLAPIIPPLMGAFAQLAAQVGGALIPILQALGPVLLSVANFLNQNASWIGPLIIGFYAGVKAVTAMTAAWKILNAVMKTNVFVLIASVVIALAILIITHWDQISAFLSKVWKGIASVATSVWNGIKDFFSNLIDSVVGFFKKWGTLILAVLLPFIGIPLLIIQHWNQIVSFFGSLVGKIGSFLASLPGVLWNAFTAAFKFALNAIIQGIEWIIALIIVIPIWIYNGLVALPGLLAQLFTWAFNTALDIITSIALAIFNFISTVPGVIIGFLLGLPDMLGNLFTNAWNWVRDTTVNIVTAVWNFISQIPGRIWNFLASLPGMLGNLATNAWNSFRNGVVSVANDVLNWISGIPRWIVDRLGDLGNLLVGAGRAIINGLLNGLKAAVGAVWDFVSGIGDKIASLKGPLPYDRKLLIPAGDAIMNGLLAGLDNGFTKVQSYVGDIADQLQKQFGDAVSVDSVMSAAVTANNVDQFAQLPDQVGYQSVDQATWDKLLAAGWKGRDDGTDNVVYRPGSGQVDASAVTGALNAAVGSNMPSSTPAAITVGNLTLQVAGNLDPTNPVAFRNTIKSIRDEIRDVERSYQ